MWVYVTEVRSIAIVENVKVNGIPKKIDKNAIKGFPDNFKPSLDVENKNAGISGTEGRPYFLVGAKYCEFDLSSGTTVFADLNKNPEMAKEALTIKYQKIEKVEARVLNGIITQSYAEAQLSPAPDQEMLANESKTPAQFAKDKIKGRIDKFAEKAKEDLKALADSKKKELLQKLKDETINRVPTFENVFSNIMRRADQNSTAALNDVVAGRNIGAAIQANVYGILPGTTIGQGLNKAAINNLGNVYTK
jgi:type II secretory pathway component PulJ